MAPKLSPLAIYGTLIAVILIALAGVLFIAPGPESNQRLGLLFALVSPSVLALVALIRSDQSAKNTNGSLDDRIVKGVLAANNARRASDIVPEDAGVPTPPATPGS